MNVKDPEIPLSAPIPVALVDVAWNFPVVRFTSPCTFGGQRRRAGRQREDDRPSEGKRTSDNAARSETGFRSRDLVAGQEDI